MTSDAPAHTTRNPPAHTKKNGQWGANGYPASIFNSSGPFLTIL